jgi:hypothetical protein
LRSLDAAAERSSNAVKKKELQDLCAKHLSSLAEGLKSGPKSTETATLLQQNEDGRWLLKKIKAAGEKE